MVVAHAPGGPGVLQQQLPDEEEQNHRPLLQDPQLGPPLLAAAPSPAAPTATPVPPARNAPRHAGGDEARADDEARDLGLKLAP